MGSSVRARVPGQEPKTSYSGYSDSRSSTAAKKDEGTLGKIKGYVPARVVSKPMPCKYKEPSHSHEVGGVLLMLI